MAFSPQSGITGSVLIGAVPYAFGKWSWVPKTNLVKCNNFTSPYQQLVAGLTSCTLTLSGPYDAGNMAFETGSSYDFILGVNDELAYTVTVLIESIKLDDDIDGIATVEISGQSSGEFDAEIT